MKTIIPSGLAMVRTAVAAVAGMTCLFAITLGAARAWEINFEGLTDPGAGRGLIIDNEYATPGGITGDPNLTATFTGYQGTGTTANPAVLFDTGNYTGGDSDLEAPFENVNQSALGNLSPGYVLILHEHPSECDGASCLDPDDRGARPSGRIEIDFGSDVVTLNSIDFFDIELAEGLPPAETNEVELFDLSGTQIMDNAFYVPATGGDNRWDVLNFGGVTGISRIVVNLHGSGAFDNIRGDRPGGPEEFQVPEPATAPLMVLGLGALVWLRRRFPRG